VLAKGQFIQEGTLVKEHPPSLAVSWELGQQHWVETQDLQERSGSFVL